MDKQDFLNQLRRSLSFIPEAEREEQLSFYKEMIDDRMEEGLSEEKAVASLGTLEEIVGRIMLERAGTEPAVPKRKLGAGEMILLILGSPIWFSLAIAAFAVAVSLYAVLWSVVGSLWAVEVSLWACVLSGLVGGLVLLFTGPVSTALMLLGAVLICAGLSVFLFFGCHSATRGSVWLTKWLAGLLKKAISRGGKDNV